MSVTNKMVRMDNRAGEQCLAANEVVSIIRDKWTILVLGALRRNELLRYTELQRAVDGQYGRAR